MKEKFILRFPKYNSMAYYFCDTEKQAKELAEKIAYESLFDKFKKESWTEHEIVRISYVGESVIPQDGDKIIVGDRYKKVKFESGWAWKVKKTCIKTHYSAKQLFEELTKDADKTALLCSHIRIIENIENEGKRL